MSNNKLGIPPEARMAALEALLGAASQAAYGKSSGYWFNELVYAIIEDRCYMGLTPRMEVVQRLKQNPRAWHKVVHFIDRRERSWAKFEEPPYEE